MMRLTHTLWQARVRFNVLKQNNRHLPTFNTQIKTSVDTSVLELDLAYTCHIFLFGIKLYRQQSKTGPNASHTGTRLPRSQIRLNELKNITETRQPK